MNPSVNAAAAEPTPASWIVARAASVDGGGVCAELLGITGEVGGAAQATKEEKNREGNTRTG